MTWSKTEEQPASARNRNSPAPPAGLSLALRQSQFPLALTLLAQSQNQKLARLLQGRQPPASGRSSRAESLRRRLALARADLRRRNQQAETFAEGLRNTGDAITRSADRAAGVALAESLERYSALAAELRQLEAREAGSGRIQFDWRSLRAALLRRYGRDWQILQYAQVDTQWWVFCLTPDSAVCASLCDLHREGDAEALALALRADDESRERLFRLESGLLDRLYRILIPAEAQARFRPDGLTVIVPFGDLHHLPFHALRAPAGQFLVEQTCVGYAPSLTSLGLLVKRAPEAASLSRALVLARSKFKHAPSLKTAPREVELLLQQFGPGTRLLLEERATLAELGRLSASGELAGYDVVHLITHGCADPRNGQASRLLLADGDLLVDDVYELKLNARTVMLSACEAGLRQVLPGDEWIGMGQSFLVAGADAVIGGLWRLADRTMPNLVNHLYRSLRAGVGPAQALALAQRKEIRLRPNPRYWAGLEVIGAP